MLSQASYIDKILSRYAMQDSKKGMLPFVYGIHLSKEQSPKTPQEVEDMRRYPYASVVESLMYAILCTRPDICYTVGMVSRFQSNPEPDHWIRSQEYSQVSLENEKLLEICPKIGLFCTIILCY